MLSKQEIAGLRELLEKATPGEFRVLYETNIMAGDGNSATSLSANYFDVAARNEANAAALVAAVNALPALLDIAEAAQWRPIESAPKARGPMIVVRGVFADRNYVTDPWCVFWQEDKWQRWPHDDPPTHWMPLPVLPLAGEVANG